MFANSRDQKSGGLKWGTRFAKDRVHGPRFDERSHLSGAQKTESDTIHASRNLWVGNVSQQVSETALAEQFSRIGDIESITVYSARNYAFINFRKEEDAVIAKRSLQGLVLNNLALRIEFAKGDSHLSSSHHVDEHPTPRDDSCLAEVVGFSGLRDSRVPGFNSDASSGRQKGDKDAEPSEYLWIGFPGYMQVDEISLRKEFSPFGDIEHITTFPGRTYAFVQFRSVLAACRAKEALQGKLFNSPRVNICFSKSEVGPIEHDRNSVNGTLPFSHKQDSHLSSSHHVDEHPRLRDDRCLAEVVGFSGLRDSRVPGFNSDASTDRQKGDKDAEPSEVLWIGFPGYMQVDEISLRKEFSPFGDIEHITTFPGRTYAFVQFRSVLAACRAKEALQGKLFNSPRVNICFSKSEVGPIEHGRISINGTLPFSHKVAINSGIASKVVENLRQGRNHGTTHGALGRPSPSVSSNPERMHSGSNINLQGWTNSMKTLGGGYDDIRASRLGFDLGATKEVSELSVNTPGIERSPFWYNNTPGKSRGGGSYFEAIRDSSAEYMASREVKRPRFGAVPGRDPFEVPFLEQGRDLQRFYPPRTCANNSGYESYKFSQFPIGNDGDVGASHCSANIIADNARHPTRPSHQIDGPWNAPNNFESAVAFGISTPLDSAKWDGHISDMHQGTLNEEWKWQGTIAKGGTPVSRARCFPVGKF